MDGLKHPKKNTFFSAVQSFLDAKDDVAKSTDSLSSHISLKNPTTDSKERTCSKEKNAQGSEEQSPLDHNVHLPIENLGFLLRYC